MSGNPEGNGSQENTGDVGNTKVRQNMQMNSTPNRLQQNVGFDNLAEENDMMNEDEGLPYQEWVMRTYNSLPIQVFVAALIFSNFIVAAAKAQMIPPEGSHADSIFEVFEVFFAVVFTIELCYNMYGHWFFPFWRNGWNWFDFIIVIISLLAIAFAGLPGISILRLFRAFRVFRLFKRIPSLRAIISGVFASLGGVANAFMVLGILMGIWSIMGVEFFGPYQSEEFGTFMRAMFTMWQVMSMDSWASQIARGVIYGQQMPFAAVYFISYLFVAGIIMANVVVAILLEKYLGAIEDINNEAKEAAEEERLKKIEQQEQEGHQQSHHVFENPLPKGMGKMPDEILKQLLMDILSPERLDSLDQHILVSVLETQACKESLFETVKLRRRSTVATDGKQNPDTNVTKQNSSNQTNVRLHDKKMATESPVAEVDEGV